jgi:hypothetical protein
MRTTEMKRNWTIGIALAGLCLAALWAGPSFDLFGMLRRLHGL